MSRPRQWVLRVVDLAHPGQSTPVWLDVLACRILLTMIEEAVLVAVVE